ncbi:hypothetical protein AKJ09_06654 [Labilithrix luteola]|uniref:Uncharacterized protein n=1 Tax=Labilithrix luteola TaxID=1391654 RepID=A0A0K1Q2F0_9BACT|nr:hypothetical protein AKJ09_06654 [Labilithrix luteola]
MCFVDEWWSNESRVGPAARAVTPSQKRRRCIMRGLTIDASAGA